MVLGKFDMCPKEFEEETKMARSVLVPDSWFQYSEAYWDSLCWKGQEREKLSDYTCAFWISEYPIGQVDAVDERRLYPQLASIGRQ